MHSLIQLRKQHSYNSLDAMDIVQHLISAMEAVHSLGLAHRDIKPKNLLLERRAQPDHRSNIPGEWSNFPYRLKLCDFGICFVDTTNISTNQKFLNVFGVSLK